MAAILYSFSFALLLFGLSAEADTEWLRVLGFAAATYMTIAGAIIGWRFARGE